MTLVLDVRRRGAVCVVQFEDGTELRCTRSFAQRTGITRGQEIEPVLIERLRETAGVELGLELARRRLGHGVHSRSELNQRLLGAGVPREAAETALNRLEALDELDDAAGALTLARISLREREHDWQEFRARCGRRLQRRGFAGTDIARALQQAWSEAALEAEDWRGRVGER